MSSPTSVAVFGSTGLTGSNILSMLLASESAWNPVHTISRRTPKSTGATLNAVVEADTDKWPPALAQITPTPSVVISAIGTTRAAAGGIQEQWKIDHDLNILIAKTAKEAGTKIFVFMSSGGTRGPGHTYMPYCQMKNGVEDAIKDLGFETAVIMKPGAILGEREQTRTAESFLQKFTYGLGKISPRLKNMLGQDAEVIARATVKAAQMAAEGKAPEKYWVVDSDQIIKLGQPEAKPEGQAEGQKK